MRETATLERGDETTCLRTAAAAGAVMELRQYVMRPGRRDELIELFEQRFVDAQEALGIRVLGIFRDLQRPDRFVWMRGFADMAERHRALESFYGGPVWAAHRDAANATMIDSDDVLLLRPARAGAVDAISAAAVLPPANNSADRGIVLAGVHLLRVPAGEEVLRYVEGELPRVLDAQRAWARSPETGSSTGHPTAPIAAWLYSKSVGGLGPPRVPNRAVIERHAVSLISALAVGGGTVL